MVTQLIDLATVSDIFLRSPLMLSNKNGAPQLKTVSGITPEIVTLHSKSEEIIVTN